MSTWLRQASKIRTLSSGPSTKPNWPDRKRQGIRITLSGFKRQLTVKLDYLAFKSTSKCLRSEICLILWRKLSKKSANRLAPSTCSSSLNGLSAPHIQEALRGAWAPSWGRASSRHFSCTMKRPIASTTTAGVFGLTSHRSGRASKPQ